MRLLAEVANVVVDVDVEVEVVVEVALQCNGLRHLPRPLSPVQA